jgi:hypothetical protein
MKKLLALSLGALLAFGMTACGAKKETKSSSSEAHQYSKTVLAGENGLGFHAVGAWRDADAGQTQWAAADDNKMTPASIAMVAEVSTGLADKLEAKGAELKYLYIMKDAVMCTNDHDDWGEGNPKAKVNGEVKTFNGTHTLKSIRAVYNEETEAYSSAQWIPNPVSGGAAHTESLSDNLWISPWKEEKDADGFSWADNPVVTDEGPGKYLIVVAQYTTASTAEQAEFGLAAIRTGDVA